MKHLRRAKLQKQIEVDIQQDWTEILHKSMAVQEFTIDARADYSAVLREELLREVGELAKNLLGLRTIRLGLLATEVLNLKSDLTLTTLRLHVKLASANLRMSTSGWTSESCQQLQTQFTCVIGAMDISC